MPLWHPLTFFFSFKHIILNKRYSRIWTQQFLQGTPENERSIDLATGSDQESRKCACVCMHIHTNVHMHITFDFRNHEFTLIPPVLVHHDRVLSCLLIPYFYVPSSSESWLPKKSVFPCSVL